MKKRQWIKIILLGSLCVSIAACHSTRRGAYQSQAVCSENAAYARDRYAEAQGLGEEARFGERASGEQLLAKRTYFFDFDSNVVHQNDIPAIRANADYLVRHPRERVLLEGHTDPRGSREYNIGLGERRAKAVAQILTAHGVSPKQIRIVSYGSQKLASEGHSEAAYQKDRRVVLLYLRR